MNMAISAKIHSFLHQWGGTTAIYFSFTHLGHDICMGLLTALLPFIREDLGLSYLQSGLLLSSYVVTSGVSQILGGWIGDKMDRRKVMIAGLCGMGLAAIAVGLSSTYHSMLVVFVLMGIVVGAYHPSAISMVSERFEEEKRGKAIALHMLGGSTGYAIGPVVGGLIAGTLGWRAAFIILSIPALAAIPIVITKLKSPAVPGVCHLTVPSKSERDTAGESAVKHINFGSVLRNLAFVGGLAITIQFAVGSAMAFFPLYLVDKYAMTSATASIWLGAVRGAGMVGTVLGGWLSDFWGRRNSVILAFAATGPVFFAVSELPFNYALIAVWLFFGMLMQFRQATVQPYLMGHTPPQYRARVFGIYFGLGMEGQSLIQPVIGHFMDIIGIVRVYSVIALGSLVLSAVSLVMMKKPKNTQ